MVRSVRRTRLEHRKSAIADLRTHSADLRVNPKSVAAHPSRRALRALLRMRAEKPTLRGPYSLRRGRAGLFFLAPQHEGSGAPRRRTKQTALARRGTHLAIGASRLSALHCGDFAPRGHASGGGGAHSGNLIQAAFAALHPLPSSH
jgi:hypothetical protein